LWSMTNGNYLLNEAKAWVKRQNGPDEVVRIVLDTECNDAEWCYKLFTAYDESPDYWGRILFDAKGYWIYDGDTLSIAEQEQLAKFITDYVDKIREL
jgi:hypothetical protein